MIRLFTLLTILIIPIPIFTQEYDTDFDMSDIEEADKTLSIHGYFSGEYGGILTNSASSAYMLQYYGQDEKDFLHQFELFLAVDAEYRNEYMGFSCQTFTALQEEELQFTIFKASGIINISLNSSLQVGKIIYNWGKGYAFNAVGFINPQKDPSDPEKIKQGITSLGFEIFFSLPSEFFPAWSFTVIAIPDTFDNSGDFNIEDTDLALKTSLLIANMDLELMARFSTAEQHQLGGDISFNLFENLELHGEIAYSWNVPKKSFATVPPDTNSNDTWSYLAGLRFLSAWNTTVILEYFHSDAGFTTSEYTDLIHYVDDRLATGNPQAIQSARKSCLPLLNNAGNMQNYLYLKLSQPEPFNILYFTPALTVIWNIDDLSLSLAAPLIYSPVNNFKLLIQPTLYLGDELSEFGSKPQTFKIDLQLIFYF